MTGSICPSLGELERLRVLDLSVNMLTGVIPTEIGQLAKLEELSLQSNKLRGVLPSELGMLASCKTIDLDSNQGCAGVGVWERVGAGRAVCRHPANFSRPHATQSVTTNC